MEKCGTAAQVAEYEERFVELLFLVGREENVIEPEKEPVHQRTDGPNQIEQCQKDDPFFDEAGGGVLGCEEGSIKCAPEQADVIVHCEKCFLVVYMEEAR